MRHRSRSSSGLEANPRVDHAVEQIDDQIDAGIEEREQEDHRDRHGIVAREDRLDRLTAETRHVEDGLDHEGSREERAEDDAL